MISWGALIANLVIISAVSKILLLAKLFCIVGYLGALNRMFTGIVQGKSRVIEIVEKDGLKSLILGLEEALRADLERGASVAVDGVCLTVTEQSDLGVSFDVMLETLSRTTLGGLAVGSEINIERSAKEGAEIGGHPLSGHVDCTAKIVAISNPTNNHVVTFEVPKEWMKYIFQKGYIAINGCSLTVASVNKDACQFDVWFIPETLRVTTFAEKKVGDLVNIEVERSTQVIVDTVRDFLTENIGKIDELHLPIAD